MLVANNIYFLNFGGDQYYFNFWSNLCNSNEMHYLLLLTLSLILQYLYRYICFLNAFICVYEQLSVKKRIYYYYYYTQQDI